MSRHDKTLRKVLSGRNDANLSFTDLCGLLKHLGFAERIRGDHHIFTREGLAEIINLQPKDGQAKPYQVRQVRKLIVEHGLADDPDDDAPPTDPPASEGTNDGQ